MPLVSLIKNCSLGISLVKEKIFSINFSLFIALIWAFVVLSCGLYSFTQANSNAVFENNILSLIPDQTFPTEDPLLKDQLQKTAERTFVILIKEKNKSRGLTIAKSFVESFQAIEGLSITTTNSELEKQIKEFYFSFRHQLLGPETRELLQKLSPQQIAERELSYIYSPLGRYSPYKFQDDPFNLLGDWMKSLFNDENRFSATEIPSIESQEGSWYLVAGELERSPFDLDLQQRLLRSIKDFKSKHSNEHFTLLTSGLIFHAAAGTEIAKKEISTVGIGSIIAIFLLVLIVFRSWKSLIFIGTVLASSMLVALSTTWLFFGQIHLVTLAFGSTLLGLAADYSFHFLTKFRATGDSMLTRNLLLKGLLVSTLSSIFAYLIQLFSPFPGLQQFSVFVASGLAAACITVLAFGPLFNKSSPNPVKLGRVFTNFFKPFYNRCARRSLLILLVGGAVILFSIVNIYQKGTDDDVRLLNTSGVFLIESEKKVQELLGNFTRQRYFFIEGKSQQEVLQKTELLRFEVSKLLSTNATETRQFLYSPTSIIPSLHQQKLDYELIKTKIFSKTGAAPILCKQLKSDCSWMQMDPKFNPNLLPALLPSVVLEIYPSINLLETNKNVVFFKDINEKSLFALSDIKISGVTYVDQISSLTNILEAFRTQVTWLLVGFFLCMILASFLLFGKKGILIIASISFSSIVALSLSTGLGITLFHVLALLLVIGISVDTSVFFITPGLNKDTWSASTLACLTSAIAFGLLSLSKVPLLHQFGSVVFFGLLCTWLITPLIYFLLGNSFEKKQKT